MKVFVNAKNSSKIDITIEFETTKNLLIGDMLVIDIEHDGAEHHYYFTVNGLSGNNNDAKTTVKATHCQPRFGFDVFDPKDDDFRYLLEEEPKLVTDTNIISEIKRQMRAI